MISLPPPTPNNVVVVESTLFTEICGIKYRANIERGVWGVIYIAAKRYIDKLSKVFCQWL